MTFVVDILLILVIAIAAYIGFRRGVVKTLLSFLAIVIALLAAFMVSTPLANLSYDMFFEQSVSSTVDAALENSAMGSVEETVENLLDSEGIIGGLGNLVGFDTQTVLENITGDSLQEVATVIKEDVIRPPMVLLLQILLFVILFVLLWILLSVAAKALSKTAKMKVIKGVNALFGGFVGLVIGVVLAFALAAIINYATLINPNGLFGITEVTRDNSVVYRLLCDIVQTL